MPETRWNWGSSAGSGHWRPLAPVIALRLSASPCHHDLGCLSCCCYRAIAPSTATAGGGKAWTIVVNGRFEHGPSGILAWLTTRHHQVFAHLGWGSSNRVG